MKWFAFFLALFCLNFACATPVKNEAVATVTPAAFTPVASAPAVSCNVCNNDCAPDCTPPSVECPPGYGMSADCLAEYEHMYIEICYFHFEEAQKCCKTAQDNWVICSNSCSPNDFQCIQACVDALIEDEDKCNSDYASQKAFDQDLFTALAIQHCCLPNLVASGLDVTDAVAMEEYRVSLMTTAYELFKADQYLVNGSR